MSRATAAPATVPARLGRSFTIFVIVLNAGCLVRTIADVPHQALPHALV